jgi:hypothetical protein
MGDFRFSTFGVLGRAVAPGFPSVSRVISPCRLLSFPFDPANRRYQVPRAEQPSVLYPPDAAHDGTGGHRDADPGESFLGAPAPRTRPRAPGPGSLTRPVNPARHSPDVPPSGQFMIAKEKQLIRCFSYTIGKSFALIAGGFDKPRHGTVTSVEREAGGSAGGGALTRERAGADRNPGGRPGTGSEGSQLYAQAAAQLATAVLVRSGSCWTP